MGLETSFREKLEWLEEAETLTLQMRAAQEARQGKSVEAGVPPAPQ